MDQLRYGVAFLHNYLASPVGQHLVAVLHAGGNGRGEDGHGLADDGPGLHGVGFQQAVEHLNKSTHTYTHQITIGNTVFFFASAAAFLFLYILITSDL